MRKILVSAIAVLAIVGAANAAIISAPTDIAAGLPGSAQLLVPISVSGGELIKSAMINAAVSGGAITQLDRLVGLFANSANAPDAPTIYTGSDGLSAVNSDFSLAFTQAAVAADGTLAILHIDTTGLAAGKYQILLSTVDAGDTSVSSAAGDVLPATLVAGSFIVTPEPTALVLLGLGGLFIRRRRA